FWLLTILQIILILSGFIITLRLFYVISSFYKKNTVPYVPTPRFIIRQMIKLSKINNTKQNKTVKAIDLGSGTGKMVFYIAAHTLKNVKIYGIEKSKLLYFISKLRWLFSPNKKRAKLIAGSWDEIKLDEFDFLFLFLTRGALRLLLPKLSRELSSKAKIITYMFPMPKNNLFSHEQVNFKGEKIFVYKKY
ncbi:MAG: class I SAM-dependent methyltransferase, partial [Candidatus Jacksonbacteria bacterium]